MMDFPNVLGILGALISFYAYARVQWQREYAKKMGYSFWNLVGSAMLIFSLIYHWNVASFVSNAVWLLASIYGCYRCLKYDWCRKDNPNCPEACDRYL